MPVGTAGTIKGIHQHDIDRRHIGSNYFRNTYHLYLKPGLKS